MKKITLILCVFLIGTVPVRSVENPRILQKLKDDFNQGRITRGQQLLYSLTAIYDPQKLPAQYHTTETVISRQTTSLKMEVMREFSTFTDQERDALKFYMSRPSNTRLDQSLISPSGRFKIHYTLNGNDAATPEFISLTASTFDHVYDVEVTEMGYLAPPIDDPNNPEYDVYVYNIGDYGATTPENSVPGTARDDYTSWIEMDNDFSQTNTIGVPAMLVTAAHEFFHMIHFGYRGIMGTVMNPIFLYETSAAWMEDVVYDDVNDYLYYLPGFYRTLNQSFYYRNGEHEYGNCLFFHMLQKKYGTDIVKEIWNEYVDHEPLDAIDQVLLEYDSNLKTELGEYAIWNYYTGDRADTLHYYPEGAAYPQVKYADSVTVNDNQKISDSVKKQSFNYYKITPFKSADYHFTPQFEGPENWVYTVINDSHTGPDEISHDLYGGNSVANLQDVQSLSTLIFCPIYASIPEPAAIYSTEQFEMKIESGLGKSTDSHIVSVTPAPFIPGRHGKVKVVFNLKETETIYANIFNENGIRIKRLRLGLCPDGLNFFEWDGTNESGEGVVSGIYLFILESDVILGPGKIALIR